VIGVGILMMVYVVFGGMLATTWVQIIKAMLLMAAPSPERAGAGHFGFSFGASSSTAVSEVRYMEGGVRSDPGNFLEPGLTVQAALRPLDLISLGSALIFGTAGLPHILIRFYTVPDAKTARVSVVWAMAIIGAFYVMTTFLGFGAATIVGREHIAANGGINMSAPLLAQALGGDVFFAFISAVAFATILAVVAGLTISASTSFAHDFWTNVVHHGRMQARRRGGAGGADHRLRGGHRRRSRSRSCWARRERGVPGGPGVRRGGLGQPAGDPAIAVSGSASIRGRGLGTGGRLGVSIGLILRALAGESGER
jgi:Na+(H+)/acetate symporter ActP